MALFIMCSICSTTFTFETHSSFHDPQIISHFLFLISCFLFYKYKTILKLQENKKFLYICNQNMLFHNKSSKISVKILILHSIQNIVKIDQVTPSIHIVSNLVNLNFPISLQFIELRVSCLLDSTVSRRINFRVSHSLFLFLVSLISI